MRRRAAFVFVVLLAAYAATLGLDAFDDSDYGGDEPHYLLTAKSLLQDGDFDVLDDYRQTEYDEFYPYPLDPHGVLTEGRLHEPHGVGFPILIAPAFEIGGAEGVELFMALIAALGGALGYLLAVRVAPDPWALGATLAVGLSPPLLAYGTAVYPELPAAAALAGAALLALHVSERARYRNVAGCFLLLGALPWLGTKFVPAGIVIGFFAARSAVRQGRRWVGFGGVEIAAISGALYIGINEALYGGPTPYAADVPGETATDAAFPLGYLERAYRVVALLIDQDVGLLRWAPVFTLALVGSWALCRTRREGLARALPGHLQAETVATVCGLAAAAQLLVAAFLAPTMFGFSFPPRHLLAGLLLAVPLVAWGLRRAPRTGLALAALSLAASAWLYVDVRWGGGELVTDRPDAPFGPLTGALPYFDESAGAYVVAGVLALVVAALVLRAEIHSRRTAGTTRATYSG